MVGDLSNHPSRPCESPVHTVIHNFRVGRLDFQPASPEETYLSVSCIPAFSSLFIPPPRAPSTHVGPIGCHGHGPNDFLWSGRCMRVLERMGQILSTLSHDMAMRVPCVAVGHSVHTSRSYEYLATPTVADYFTSFDMHMTPPLTRC